MHLNPYYIHKREEQAHIIYAPIQTHIIFIANVRKFYTLTKPLHNDRNNVCLNKYDSNGSGMGVFYSTINVVK